jgi:hypothetical protein
MILLTAAWVLSDLWSVAPALCQPAQEWFHVQPGPAKQDDQVRGIAADELGNVYIGGTGVFNHTSSDFILMKYSPQGIRQWVTSYNSPSDASDEAWDFAFDAAGNSYLTGRSNDDYSNDYLTVKFDPQGQLLWEARYNGPFNGHDWALAVAPDVDGNVYVTGTSDEAMFCTTIKYNPQGVQQWVAQYDGPAHFYAEGRFLDVDGEGNVYVGGDASPDTFWNPDFSIIKYNPQGVEQWSVLYSGTPDDPVVASRALKLDAQSNVIMTGKSATNWDNGDITTVKYNSAGVLQWAVNYDSPENGIDNAEDLVVDAAGNIIITGKTHFTSYWYMITLKYDPNGNLLWERRYGGQYADALGFGLAVDGHDNLYVTGQNYGSSTTLKYHPNGDLLWTAVLRDGIHVSRGRYLTFDPQGDLLVAGSLNFHDCGDDNFLTIKYHMDENPASVEPLPDDPFPTSFGITVSPNPFNPSTALSYKLQASSHVSLKVYDTSGRLVATFVDDWREAGEHRITFEGSGLSSGLYFAKLTVGDFHQVQKMILMK